MQKVAVVVAALFVLACAKAKIEKQPLSEPGETVYPLRGVVVGRDVADNTLRVDHEQIPGYMEAMTMDYPVRGVAVAALPADKSRVEAKLHVHDDRVWLTDVKRMP
jgi:protein SCO1/2